MRLVLKYPSTAVPHHSVHIYVSNADNIMSLCHLRRTCYQPEVRRTGSVNLDREPHSICGPKGLNSQCHHVAPVLDVARTFQNYFCLLRIWVLLNHTTPARFSPKFSVLIAL